MKSFLRKMNRWAPWPWLLLLNIAGVVGGGIFLYVNTGQWFLVATGLAGIGYTLVGWRIDIKSHLKGRR